MTKSDIYRCANILAYTKYVSDGDIIYILDPFLYL